MCRRRILAALSVLLLGPGSGASGQIGRGNILFEWWYDISGDHVQDLIGHFRYPDSPDESAWLERFEGPVDWKDNYGTRARGYLYPPADGAYTFWVSGDDYTQLFLSTDAEQGMQP